MRLIRELLLIVLLLLFSTALYAAQVTVAWQPNSESDLAGYKVYWGNASGVYDNSFDVGNVTNYMIKRLAEGTTVYIAGTAYDISGNESAYSIELVHEIPSAPVIKPPSGFTVRGKLKLQWYKSRDTSVIGYKIYYGTEPDKYTEIVDVPGRDTTRKELDLAAGVYYFRVSNYDALGNESPLSAEVKKEVELPPVEGVKVIE